mmetsp:Transcript_29500/g.55841  ORF Transcript_29500/g.55841 Transcript_29500/m.55841 type:complete len:129 (-) Transcript_29500:338-724(-)
MPRQTLLLGHVPLPALTLIKTRATQIHPQEKEPGPSQEYSSRAKTNGEIDVKTPRVSFVRVFLGWKRRRECLAMCLNKEPGRLEICPKVDTRANPDVAPALLCSLRSHVQNSHSLTSHGCYSPNTSSL